MDTSPHPSPPEVQMNATNNHDTNESIIATVIGLSRIVGFVKEVPFTGPWSATMRKAILLELGAETCRIIEGKPGVARAVKSGHYIVDVEIDSVRYAVWIESPIKAMLGMIDELVRTAIEKTAPETIEVHLQVGRKGTTYYKVDQDHIEDWVDRAVATNPTLKRRRRRAKCWREIRDLFRSAKDSLAARKGLRTIVAKYDVQNVDQKFEHEVWTFTGKVDNLGVKVTVDRNAIVRDDEEE